MTRVERDKNLIGIIDQGRFRLLANLNECAARGIELDCHGACIPGWTAHVERYGKSFGSHLFWIGLRVELELDGIIGCCPLVAPP